MKGQNPIREEKAGPVSLGRKLAVLRAALNITQSYLARNSKVKRASISEYEADLTNPDASTLEKLLGTMRFKWAALDLAGWFLARLFTECRLSKDAFLEAADPISLDAMAAEMSEMATKLRGMAEALRARKQEEESGSDAVGAQPAEPSSEDRATARPLVQRLRTLARPKQSAELQEIPERLRWAVCETLCLDSQRLAADDPTRAAALAELALEAAALACGENAWRAKLGGLASAHLGNALRAAGDHEGGNRAFDMALASWEAGKDANPGLLEEGLVYALQASLRRAERRFEEATDLLTRSAAAASGVRFRVQVEVSRAKLAEETGGLEEAVAILAGAVETEIPGDDGRLVLCVHHNLADALSKLDRFKEADAHLPVVRDLSRKHGGEIDAVRLLWTEGRVAAGLGKIEDGITALTRVRGAFVSRHMSYDMALVSLELAVLYAGEGRTDQVKTLARHMAPIFKAQDVHREALAALTLFRQAAEKERVTSDFARELLSYLRNARYDPELRFEKGA
jgi:transcriptional regulator with XRE-family HTH domain